MIIAVFAHGHFIAWANTMYDVKKQEEAVTLERPQVVSIDEWKMPSWVKDISDCVDLGGLGRARSLLSEDQIENHTSSLLMPEKGFVLVAVARLLKRIGEYERAESRYKQLLVQCPDNPSVLNEIACSMEEWGRTRDAAGYLARAIAIDPHDSRLWESLVGLGPWDKREGPLEDLLEHVFSESNAKFFHAKATHCWCGGPLENSIHPAYGRCQACRTFVLRWPLTSEELGDFYTFRKYWHTQAVQVKNFPPIEKRVVEDLRDRIPVWFGWISDYVKKYNPLPDRLFEIGCAHGGFLAYCRKQGVKTVVGNEPDQATCEFARELFGLPHLVTGLFPDVVLPFDTFGIIVAFDVFEHMLDPIKALEKIFHLLSGEGICLLQVPFYKNEGPEWQAFRPPEHIYLYDSETIHWLFDRAGLEILEITHGCFKYDTLVVVRRKVSPE